MNEIKFIPLIEPPTLKDENSELKPEGLPFTNQKEWDIYQKKEIEKNYSNFPEPIQSGIYQYNLFEISLNDMENIIDLHIGDTDIEDSNSLFGGYALSINSKIELFPQCCGLLEEIQLWKNILKGNFTDFYLTECHPSPLITKRANEIIIICEDEYETFIPVSTQKEIRLNYNKTVVAFNLLLKELEIYSNNLNKLSEKFKVDNLANIIIWGKE